MTPIRPIQLASPEQEGHLNTEDNKSYDNSSTNKMTMTHYNLLVHNFGTEV